jgi:hypothetical protein
MKSRAIHKGWMRASALFGLVFAGSSVPMMAQASDVRWSVTIGSPGYHRPPPAVVYAPPPVVYHQAPQVVYPAPYVVYQAPVVVHPRPVVSHPGYIVVAPPGHHDRRWKKHHWKNGYGPGYPNQVYYGHPGHRYDD